MGDEQRAAAQAANDEDGMVDYATAYYGSYANEAWEGFKDWASSALKTILNGLYLYGGITTVMVLRLVTHAIFSLINDVLSKGVEDTFRLPDPTMYTNGTFRVAPDFGTSSNVLLTNCSVRAWNHGNAPSIIPVTTTFRDCRWVHPTTTVAPAVGYSAPYKPFTIRMGGSL
uniref:Uncharacterized protein n=1 Tax=viral metagenome TaxID=1070528 RepID=A0A2V0RHA2_9ZZZZ